jgi:hypothetical protein
MQDSAQRLPGIAIRLNSVGATRLARTFDAGVELPVPQPVVPTSHGGEAPMNLRTHVQFVAGLALVLSIVVVASVAAHPPLPGAPDLPLHIDGAATVPLVVLDPQGHFFERLGPPTRALPAPGFGQLLPNWEVGRNAVMLLPNYESGMATFELLELHAISDPAPLLVAPRAAPTDADKP